MFKSKKTLIAILTFLFILAGIGFYLYQKGYFEPRPEPPPVEKFLTLEIKNPNLTDEAIKLYQDKFAILKERLQKDPNSYYDLISLGIIKKGVADFEGARDVWIYVTQIDPKGSQAFANLGNLYANFLNEPQKAEAAYKEALARDPNDINYLMGLADVYRWRLPGKEYLYEEILLEGLKRVPENPELIGYLASYYKQTGQIDKAIEYYEKLIQLVPDNQVAKEDLEELKKLNQK